MDQKPTPTFSINMIPNPGKSRYGKDLPNYRGYVAAPEHADRKFNVALWSSTFVDKDGQELIALNGAVDGYAREDSAIDQMRATAGRTTGGSIEINNIVLEPGKVVLFQSKHENGNVAENGKRRTDFYGYWNNNGQRVDVGGWANKSKDGRQVSIVGRTQPPMAKEELGANFEPASDTELAALNRAADAEHENERETRKRSGARSR